LLHEVLVDAHLPPSLCNILNEASHDAIHTTDLPQGNETPDTVINEGSAQQDRIVISKDTDFYYSHLLSQKPRKLLLVRTGNIGARDLKALFQNHLPTVVRALEVNSLVELDRSKVRIII
jgi:predicted nuclease of predicted toxin-antitoxin system